MRILLFLLTICLATLPAFSAKLTYLGETTSEDFDIQSVNPFQACNMRLSGVINKGDLGQIESQVSFLHKKSEERNSSHILVICLDSPGGSFAEAVKIGKFLKKTFIGTKIEKGAKCESACSLIFMSGNFAAHESGIFHWRVLHPQSKLGFHSPSLTLGDGQYDSKTVQKAYNLALRTISDTIFQIMSSNGFDDGLSMEVSLLGEMLKTPSSQMSYVDTIDKAGRWRIDLMPAVPDRRMTRRLYAQGCVNAYSWNRDETAANENYGSIDNIHVEAKSGTDGVQKIVVTLNELTGDGCTFFVENGNDMLSKMVRVDILDKGSHLISMEHFLDPTTPLATLASLAPATAKPAQPELPNFSGPADAQSTGECLVISGNSVIDREPCFRADNIKQDNNGKRVDISSFVWPSGAKTVIVFKSKQLSINGHRTKNVSNAIAGEKASCVINPSSGNIFCYRPK